AEDGIRDGHVTGVQTCALPIYERPKARGRRRAGRDLHERPLAGLEDGPAVSAHPLDQLRHTRDRRRAEDEVDRRRAALNRSLLRSEERRVGKEWRSRRRAGEEK